MRVAPAEKEMELTERVITEGENPSQPEKEAQEVTNDGDKNPEPKNEVVGDRLFLTSHAPRPKTGLRLPPEQSGLGRFAGTASPSTFVNSDSEHIHYTQEQLIGQMPRFRRPNFGMSQILPTLCLILIIIAIVSSLSILLPAQLGLQMSTAEERTEIPMNRRSILHEHDHLCNKEPPSPGCLVWDWKQGNYDLGTIINYWCASTTSFTVYATVECIRNQTWVVTSYAKDLPCNCQTNWLF